MSDSDGSCSLATARCDRLSDTLDGYGNTHIMHSDRRDGYDDIENDNKEIGGTTQDERYNTCSKDNKLCALGKKRVKKAKGRRKKSLQMWQLYKVPIT